MRMTRRLFLAAPALGILRAQEPVFSADSRVVTLLASVRDANGKLIPNLGKDDFELTDAGAPAEIRYFSQETDLPLTISLLIDTSKSQFAVIERERRGAYAFLDRILRPDRDVALVVSFDARVHILCRPTAALPELQKALSHAELPLNKKAAHKRPNAEPKKQDIAGGTKLQTAVKECSDRYMQKAAGRKAILLLTDGVDEGSRTTLDEAIEHAQHADTLVYSVLYADPRSHPAKPNPRARFPTAAARGRHILTELAGQTGGSLFIVGRDNPLEQILDEIQAELRTQYSIGFTPAAAGSGEYRKLTLTAKRPDLIVRAREGYYAR